MHTIFFLAHRGVLVFASEAPGTSETDTHTLTKVTSRVTDVGALISHEVLRPWPAGKETTPMQALVDGGPIEDAHDPSHDLVELMPNRPALS